MPNRRENSLMINPDEILFIFEDENDDEKGTTDNDTAGNDASENDATDN